MTRELDSAHLFTPGRASYIETTPAGFTLRLTAASLQRGEVAAKTFDEDFHTAAVFAGGYPGLAQHWPPEHTPPLGAREADLMAKPLERKLSQQGWDDDAINNAVLRQGESTNSIGDVARSIRLGYLDPNDYHCDDNSHGIHLVAGRLHGKRFRAILVKALAIDPALIIGADIHDPYGIPATEFRSRERAPVAIAKELAALALTYTVLHDVRPGNLDDLLEAERRFANIAGSAASPSA